MTERLTKEPCPQCKNHHPASEGITIYTREFECVDCDLSWQDTWCCDCDDSCPECGETFTSLTIIEEDVIEEPSDDEAVKDLASEPRAQEG